MKKSLGLSVISFLAVGLLNTIALADNHKKENNKYFSPTKNICIKNGGEYYSGGVKLAKCSTKSYKSAISICKAEGANLIDYFDAKNIVESCGGKLDRRDIGTSGFFGCISTNFGGGDGFIEDGRVIDFLNGVIYDQGEGGRRTKSVICVSKK